MRYLESIDIVKNLYAEYGAKYAGRFAVNIYFLAETYKKAGDKENATKWLFKAIKILEEEDGEFYAGKLAIYYSALSEIESDAGDTKNAEEHLNKSKYYAKTVKTAVLGRK